MTDLRSDLRADLQADLLADLAAGQAPSTATGAHASSSDAPEPALPTELTEATPALSLSWTPLRWSRPRVVRAYQGTGKALRVGPFALEVAVRDT